MLLFFIFAALGVELFGDLGKFSAVLVALNEADICEGSIHLIHLYFVVVVAQNVMLLIPVRAWGDMRLFATLGWPFSHSSVYPQETTGMGS